MKYSYINDADDDGGQKWHKTKWYIWKAVKFIIEKWENVKKNENKKFKHLMFGSTDIKLYIFKINLN